MWVAPVDVLIDEQYYLNKPIVIVSHFGNKNIVWGIFSV